MVFLHDPRSEDIPVDEVNEGHESSWRSLCCFGNNDLQSKVKVSTPMAYNVNACFVELETKMDRMLGDFNEIKNLIPGIGDQIHANTKLLAHDQGPNPLGPAKENSNLSDANNNITVGSSVQNIVLKPNASTDIMEDHHSKRKDKNIMENPQSSKVPNIILNDDFSEGLKFWKVTSKGGGYVVPKVLNYLEDILPYSGVNYLVINRRTEIYDGLEQDITERISENLEYTFSAWVRLYGGSLGADGKAEVRAMLRLDYSDQKSEAKWALLAREYVSTDGWKNFVGHYKFEDMPTRVIFFFEGPEAGVDVLIDSVVMSSSVV